MHAGSWDGILSSWCFGEMKTFAVFKLLVYWAVTSGIIGYKTHVLKSVKIYFDSCNYVMTINDKIGQRSEGLKGLKL